MSEVRWTKAQKAIARRAFDAALEGELAEVMAEFKRRAAAATQPGDMWAVEKYLERARRDINEKYDYRYSQLPIVFGRLLREKRIREEDLDGISEDILECVRGIASFRMIRGEQPVASPRPTSQRVEHEPR